MDTHRILSSPKTERVLWVLIIGTFILSLVLNQVLVEPRTNQQEEQIDRESASINPSSAETELPNISTTNEQGTQPPETSISTEPQQQPSLTPDNTFNSFEQSLLQYERRAIELQGDTLTVAVANSIEQKILGLSFTERIPSEIDGLLFVYEPGSNPGIWMKDMNYPINIYWLDEQYNIMHQELNVSPETYPTTFYSPAPSSFVLETPV